MSLLRAFIAVEIPIAIRQAVREVTSDLQKGMGSLVRWVPMENMHLTLKFLGDISASNVDMLTQMIRSEVDLYNCFQLNGLGSFPDLKRPRVIYIGIQAPAALVTLHRGIESASRRLGYESEERGFSPHLTIGRVKQNVTVTEQQTIRRALAGAKIDSLGTARVDSVHLFRSDLKPTGSVYTLLYSAPLKKWMSLRGVKRRSNPRMNWEIASPQNGSQWHYDMRWYLNALELAHKIVAALEDKKGEDILLLDIKDIASFTDYFVICNGTSDRMLDALAKGVLDATKQFYKKKGRVEGQPEEGWLVLDYGDVVVHLFSPDQREYYDLEELWSDGKVLLRVQ
jgi:2'-5' RNA ligase/ribosome silencing factor RsfS/YbeB/iojap